MARKRHLNEDVLKLLRGIKVKLVVSEDMALAWRSVGINDTTYFSWRKRFGGMGLVQLSELKSLGKVSGRLKKIVAVLELDKLIFKECLNHLKPRA